jgi:hypothetical protein
MLLGPAEIALRIQYQHYPGWLVWYGKSTKWYWALACWVLDAPAMVGAATPAELDTVITIFEMLHPKHRERLNRAVGPSSSPGRTHPRNRWYS